MENISNRSLSSKVLKLIANISSLKILNCYNSNLLKLKLISAHLIPLVYAKTTSKLIKA